MRYSIRFLFLAAFLLGSFRPAVALVDQQAESKSPQVLFVTDVSGSMGYYVLSKDLPGDLQIMQQQVAEIQDNPEYLRLTHSRSEISKDPLYEESLAQYYQAATRLEEWLKDHAYRVTDALNKHLETRFIELGCELGYQDMYDYAKHLDEARSLINDACKYASISQAELEELLGTVAFLDQQEYLDLRQARDEMWEAHQNSAEQLGFYQVNADLERFLNIASYYDLETRINIRARELGYPTRLDLARQTANTILDISRLDLQASGRQTRLGLVKFSTLGELAQPLTADFDSLEHSLNDLSFNGATNIGDGLNQALDEIELHGDPQQPAAIILYSDGEANRGMTSQQMVAEIPPRARALNVRICAVGFANREQDIDAELLKALSQQTGGQYHFATSGAELISFYTSCRQGLLSDQINQLTGQVKQGQTVEAGKFQVEQNTDVLELTLTYLTGQLEMVLVDPSGRQIDRSYPGVEIQQGENVQLITIDEPLPSEWVVRVSSSEAPAEGSLYSVTIGSQTNPNPQPTHIPTLAYTPTPVPVAPLSQALLPPVAISALICSLTLIILAGFLVFFRRREQQLQPFHWAVAAVVLMVMCGLVSGIVGSALFSRYSSGADLPVIGFLIPSPTLPPTSTHTLTPSPTAQPTFTPTPLPSPTPAPSATPVPVIINGANTNQVVYLNAPIDNSVPGYGYSRFFSMDISADGQQLAVDGYYCPTKECLAIVKLWQVLPDGLVPVRGMLPEAGAALERINELKFSPDGSQLAAAGSDQNVYIWNAADGSLDRTLRGHGDEVESLDFSPDGSLLASSGSDNIINLWQVSDGNLVRSMKGSNEFYDVEFSPDGSLLASGSRDLSSLVRIWRVEDGKALANLSGHSQTVVSLGFSPDGSLLASGDLDGVIVVYEMPSGRRLYTAHKHQGAVYGLAFSPDGSLLASAGQDQVIRLWDARSGSLLSELRGHNDRIYNVVFGIGGARLISAAQYEALRLWGIPP